MATNAQDVPIPPGKTATQFFRIIFRKLTHYNADGTSAINILGSIFEQALMEKDAEIVKLNKQVVGLIKDNTALHKENKKLKKK